MKYRRIVFHFVYFDYIIFHFNTLEARQAKYV
jgi:hypothetical protein